jgi:hypothetical protein
MREKKNAYIILVLKPEVKRLLGSPRCRWDILLNGPFRNRVRGRELDSSGPR